MHILHVIIQKTKFKSRRWRKWVFHLKQWILSRMEHVVNVGQKGWMWIRVLGQQTTSKLLFSLYHHGRPPSVPISVNWDGQDLVVYSHGWPDMGLSGQAEFIWLHLARWKQVSNLRVRSAPPVDSTCQILSVPTRYTIILYVVNFGKSILVFPIGNSPFAI